MRRPKSPRRAPPRAKLFSFEGDCAVVGQQLREWGYNFAEGDPTSVTAWRERSGKIRRMVARWAGGWICTIRWRAAGGGTIVWSWSTRIKIKKEDLA